MIKLKQVMTVHGETILVFEADGFPGAVKTVEISMEEVMERLRLLKQITGRQPTLEDAKDIAVTLVKQLRQGGEALTQRFDFSGLINMDLEEAEEEEIAEKKAEEITTEEATTEEKAAEGIAEQQRLIEKTEQEKRETISETEK